jgi:3-oxoacyl-[acyl-carrier protein] reductase
MILTATFWGFLAGEWKGVQGSPRRLMSLGIGILLSAIMVLDGPTGRNREGDRMGVLTRQVAIVTGAAKGFGEAIAREFASEGAKVALVDIDSARAESVASELAAAGAEAHSIEADVSHEAAVRAMVAEVVQNFGAVHILVNNAGIYPRYIWHEMSAEEWDRIQAVNLKSCFLCSRAVFPLFKVNRKGKSSIYPRSPFGWVPRPILSTTSHRKEE